MPSSDFWDGDPSLVKAYRIAYETKIERQNDLLHLQGKYIYDALVCVAPIFRSFAKTGTKAHDYPEEPYPITRRRVREEQEKKDRLAYENNLARMKKMMLGVNKGLEEKR